MKTKEKILYVILIFLFIIISHYIYYNTIRTILFNYCIPNFSGGLIIKNSILSGIINSFKVGDDYTCNGYLGFLENTKLTLSIYILFLWLTVIPFTIKKFELKKKYSFFKNNVFYITLLILLLLIILFLVLSIILI